MKCKHKFVHLETIYDRNMNGYRTYIFTRIDRFFCEKCLEEQVKKIQTCGLKEPEWWNKER